MVTGVAALGLAALSLLAVAAFHAPQYLTTPDLRAVYDVAVLRMILLAALVVAGGLALGNLLLGRARWLNGTALALVAVAVALGGHTVPVGDVPPGTPYLGLDWFILDLLASTVIFVLVEKVVPLDPAQPIFRAEWQTDTWHFAVNHLLIGVFLAVINRAVHAGFDWAVFPALQAGIQRLPFLVELLLAILVADLAQYWVHRAYHEIPALWRLHAVHHSVRRMDWLAGSRQHLLEVVLTRTLVLAPIFVLGFSEAVIDVYIVIVGLQAVFNHANVNVTLGPLGRIVVTPHFHHWHHSQDTAAIDRNYAAHFAFLDRLFGTAVDAGRMWPHRYGVKGDYMPPGFVRQQAFPFTWDGKQGAAAQRR